MLYLASRRVKWYVESCLFLQKQLVGTRSNMSIVYKPTKDKRCMKSFIQRVNDSENIVISMQIRFQEFQLSMQIPFIYFRSFGLVSKINRITEQAKFVKSENGNYL